MGSDRVFRILFNISMAVTIVVGLSAVFFVERMSPAIQAILEENAFSVAAAVEMQELLSTSLLTGPSPAIAARFAAALQRARGNVTLAGERELIDKLALASDSYFAGTREVAGDLAQHLGALARINLSDMEQKDERASFLGLAGAWSIGALLILALLVQLALHSLIQRKVLEPVDEVATVLNEYSEGQRLRRVNTAGNLSEEVKRTGRQLNDLLDRSMGWDS